MIKAIVIDDSPEDRELLADLLKRSGVSQVAPFSNPNSAVEHLSDNSANFVFVDYRLENQDLGLVHLGAIKARVPSPQLFIVTGSGFLGLDRLVEKFGVAFLSKDNLSVELLTHTLELDVNAPSFDN